VSSNEKKKVRASGNSLIFAGIDGGGTRTRLALSDGDGRVIAVAETGCCSFVELGRERARREIRKLWHQAWREAHMQPRLADALFIGSGSILSDADAQVNCELSRTTMRATRLPARCLGNRVCC
jgi:N-acetylglucosamine kinase-like BadF-type ATPase